jgi:hypothetical protein
MEGDQFGVSNRGVLERSHGQVQARDVVAFPDQPGLRRTQAERLMAELVGGD